MSSFNNTGGKFSFFFYDMNVFKDVPFGIVWKLQQGILKINDKSEEYNIILNNMMDSYCSYIENYININTGEISSLPLYRLKSKTETHNVYSSMLYIIVATSPSPFKIILETMKEQLKIDDMNLVRYNYYDHFYSDPIARILVITETKIYFWWYFLFKRLFNTTVINNESKNSHMPFFMFYLWCFRNLGNLNRPFIPGNKNQLLPEFDLYFNLIDNSDLNTQFKLRYGPKYLNEKQLTYQPKLILRKFQ